MLWAVLAPLFLIIAAWLLVKLIKLPWRIAGLIVIGITMAVWLPQRIAFRNRCTELGEPTVVKTETVDGFFLDDSTANSFGMRYLQEPGFSWIEAKSIFDQNKFTRYEKVGDKIEQKEVANLTAKFVVRSNVIDEGYWSVNETAVSNLETGEKLAWARGANFEGGTAKWVLGVYGTASCPDPRSEAGSRAFTKMYRLAWEVLRANQPKK